MSKASGRDRIVSVVAGALFVEAGGKWGIRRRHPFGVWLFVAGFGVVGSVLAVKTARVVPVVEATGNDPKGEFLHRADEALADRPTPEPEHRPRPERPEDQ